VAAVHSVTPYDLRITDPDFMDSIRKAGAHLLLDELLKAGYVITRQGTGDKKEMRGEIVTTIGVVSPHIAATLEERALEAGKSLAAKVVEEIKERIRIWGGDYNHRSINKTLAVALVDEALKAVTAREEKALRESRVWKG
jgi:hypothetical protein